MERAIEARGLLFDWDGTILDSSALAFAAFCNTFTEFGIPFDEQDYESTYSPDWYAMYRKLGLAESRWEEADALWLQHYGRHIPSLVPGARRTLTALIQRDYRMGLVSSGSRDRVRREVEALELASFFEVLVCHEDTVRKKPDPEGLLSAMDTMGLPPRDCVYIGDSPEDIQMGRNARTATVGVAGGYPGSRFLRKAGPDLYLESLLGLLEHF